MTLRKTLFNLLSLLSVLILLAVGVLWLRSHDTADYFAFCGQTSESGMISAIGRIVFYRESAISPFRWQSPFGFQYAARTAPDSISRYSLPNSSVEFECYGFGGMRGDNGRYQATAIYLPHWAAAATASFLPMLWLLRRIRSRHKRGRGFEIVGSPSGSVPRPLLACPPNRL